MTEMSRSAIRRRRIQEGEPNLDWKLNMSERVVHDAKEWFEPAVTAVMFSGGNDSSVLVHAMQEHADGVLHINTTVGIADTRAFVRAYCKALGLELWEVEPPPVKSPEEAIPVAKTERTREQLKDLARRVEKAGIVWENHTPYEQFVMRFGFPGPGGHMLAYSLLKNRALVRWMRETPLRKRGEPALLMTGVRWAESERRMGNAELVSKVGSQVWLAPIVHLTSDDMWEYRDRFGLPRNEVSDHLHMSGECLCGSYAKQGELEEIRFFYPRDAEYLESVQELARRMGHEKSTWGARAKGGRKTGKGGMMCHDCDNIRQHRH